MDEPIKVYIVDDLRLLREGVVSLLAKQEGITIVGTAASGSKALEKIKTLCPEVALIDIGMPNKDGLTLTRALRHEAPKVKVLIFGMTEETDEIISGIEAGASRRLFVERSLL